MKISSPSRDLLKTLAIAAMIGAIAGLAYYAYAATNIAVTNTGTVTTGANLSLAAPTCGTGGNAGGGDTVCEFGSTTTCSGSSGAYNTATSSYTIADWSVAQGASTSIYLCLQNNGTAAHALLITWNSAGATAGISCSSPTSGTSVPNGPGYQLVTLSCTATGTTVTGSANFGSFAIS